MYAKRDGFITTVLVALAVVMTITGFSVDSQLLIPAAMFWTAALFHQWGPRS